jgi:hypothetical protein
MRPCQGSRLLKRLYPLMRAHMRPEKAAGLGRVARRARPVLSSLFLLVTPPYPKGGVYGG